jgi:hypothetical protein
VAVEGRLVGGAVHGAARLPLPMMHLCAGNGIVIKIAGRPCAVAKASHMSMTKS